MSSGIPEFLNATDADGFVYFFANPDAIARDSFVNILPGAVRANDKYSDRRPPDVTAESKDICSFLDDQMSVTRLATDIFSSDLTDGRDDIILAVLSLLVVFAIEGILAVILLRKYNGQISSFGLSIKHFIDFIKDFRVGYLVPGQRKQQHSFRSRLNAKLIISAGFILTFMLGLEALILVLTSEGTRKVTSHMASFRLLPVINPNWNIVRDRANDPFDRPCRDVKLPGVRTGLMRITACLTSSVLQSNFEPFEKVDGVVGMTIRSYVHEFGIEHVVRIGNQEASYSARADFRLGDGETRLMPQRIRYFDKGIQLGFIHKQLVAFLFSAYRNETGDMNMNLDRLEAINFNFTADDEDKKTLVDIVQLNGDAFGMFRQIRAVRHTTTLSGVVPRGIAAFRFAQMTFAGSIGIVMSGPEINDLHLGSGNTVPLPSVLWMEDARTLNWLSLTIILFCSVLLLSSLRSALNSAGIAEMAAAVVEEAVGARPNVSPLFWDGEEQKYFNINDVVEMFASPECKVDDVEYSSSGDNGAFSEDPSSPAVS